MKSRLVTLLALVSLWTLLAMPSSALAAPDIPTAIDGASLQARGRLVIVDITFTCAISKSYRIEVIVRHSLMTSFGKESGSCKEGETVSESVRVNPEEGYTFKAGSAYAIVSVAQDIREPHLYRTLTGGDERVVHL